jgi:flotillin
MAIIEDMLLPILLGVGVIAVFAAIFVASRNYKKFSPSELAVISGRMGTRYKSGGATLIIPLLEDYWVIPSGLMTLAVEKTNVQTKTMVPIDIDAVIQLQLRDDIDGYRNAARAFLGNSSPAQIAAKIEPTLEGHIRAVCSGLEIVPLLQDRDSLNKKVLENAKEDLEKIGLDIKSFQIRDIRDSSATTQKGERGYISSLSAKEVAEKRKVAEIAEAQAKSEARKAVALANEQASEQENIANTKIAEYQKGLATKKAAYNQEINIAEAIATKSGEIELAKQEQIVKQEQMTIDLVEKQRAVDIAEQEKLRRQKEGEAEKLMTIAKAEGESARVKWEGIGQAEASKAKLLAEADGNKARLLANAEGTKAGLLAEAEGTRAKLLAEAEGIDKKADAYKKLNDAGLEIMKIQMLPEIAKNIATPLSQIGEKITIVQTPGKGDTMGIGGSMLGTIEQAFATLPAIFKAVGVTPPKAKDEEETKERPELQKFGQPKPKEQNKGQ